MKLVVALVDFPDVYTCIVHVSMLFQQGILAETMRPRYDESGKQLLAGQVLKADTEFYMVKNAFGIDFPAKHMKERRL